MFKNQLQELAQRSCFNLPSYACIREGPDHAPRFKASVNFNGEIFESPSYCSTLRQAEHAAAEVALNVLSTRGPSRSLTARVLDETGIYKNLLQETAHRAGLNLPVYTTVRSGPGHVPTFTCTVELAGMNFTGEPAKTKKQAEKNAAIAAWSALKRMPNFDSLTFKETDTREEQDQAIVAKVLSNFRPKDDNKNARRRDQNQARRRMVRGQREYGGSTATSSSSSTCSSNSLQYHRHLRLLDLLMESAALDGSKRKQNSFVSLLPPPPPRTTSKILPPSPHKEDHHPLAYNTSSNRPPPIAIQARGRNQEIPTTPLDEHQKDEEEWLGGIQDGINKSIENSAIVYGASSISKPFSQPSTSKLDNTMFDTTPHVSSRLFGSLNPSPMTLNPFKSHTLPTHIAKSMYTGGVNPQRIAPAVQIRSVIPVCAAPPAPTMKKPSSQPSKSTASPSTTVTSSMSTQTGAEASSSVSSMFNKLQL